MLFYALFNIIAFTNINNLVIRINKIIDAQNIFWNYPIIQLYFFNNQNIYLMYFFNIDGKNNKSKTTAIVAEIIVIKAS